MPKQWLADLELLSLKQLGCDLATQFGREYRRNRDLSIFAGQTCMSGGVGRAVSNDGPYPI